MLGNNTVDFNALANTLKALKKTANVEANKVKGTQQTQLQGMRDRLQHLEKNFAALHELFAHDYNHPEMRNAAFKAATFANHFLFPYVGRPESDPALIAALNDENFNNNLNFLLQITEAFKRNQELKLKFLEQLRQEDDTTEAFRQKREALIALLEEEEALMLSINPSNIAPTQTLADINRKWAELLHRVFNIKGLAELQEKAQTTATQKPKNATAQWGQNFFAAISGLFKALNDPTQDSKAATMNFMGTMIQLVVGLFANMFKSFLGKNAAPQVEELTQNVSGYFTNVLSEAYAREDAKEKNAKQAQKKSKTDFTPGFTKHKGKSTASHRKASTKPTFSDEPNYSSGYSSSSEDESEYHSDGLEYDELFGPTTTEKDKSEPKKKSWSFW